MRPCSASRPLLLNLMAQIGQDTLSLTQMSLQTLNLLAHSLDIFPRPFQILPILRPTNTLPQLSQFPFLILQKLKRLLLNQHPIWPAITTRPITSSLGCLAGRLQLRLHLSKLPTQPDLLPLLVLDRFAKVRALGRIRALAADTQSAQVGIAKFGLAAGSCLLVAVCAPALGGGIVVDLVVDLVAFEGGAQRGGDGAWDAEALVAVVEDVEEGEGGIFVDGLGGGGVDEVPCGADVGVWDIEGFVEWL